MADDEECYVAREIERDHPDWIVLWGCYSRLFWAFPRFLVPRGTIVSAPIRDLLIADMRSVEAEFTRSPRGPGYPQRPGHAQAASHDPTGHAPPLPRRVPLGQRERQQQPVPIPAPVPPPEHVSNNGPYAPGPVDWGGDNQWADAHADEANRLAPD